MAKQWDRWRGGQWEPEDDWPYPEESFRYGWLKKTLAAAALFAVVYGAYSSGTFIGSAVGGGVKRALSEPTDFAYLAERIGTYAPGRDAMWRRVQAVLARPADPRAYWRAPVENGRIVAHYGWRTHPVTQRPEMNEGLEVAVPPGAGVRAAAAGTVRAVTGGAPGGKAVILSHGRDMESVYGRLGEVLVKKGDLVTAGQVIAKAGAGRAKTPPVIYFELRENGKPVDPLSRMPNAFAPEGGQ